MQKMVVARTVVIATRVVRVGIYFNDAFPNVLEYREREVILEVLA